MVRLNFESALREGMRRAPAKPTATSVAGAGEGMAMMISNRSGLMWTVYRVVRAPAALVRRFLVGALHAKLDQAHHRLDQIQGSTSGRFDNVEIMLGHQRTLIEQLQARNDELARAVTALHGFLDAKVHQLEVKVRAPIDYDADTRAIRTVDGYVLVPKAARELSVLLADAPAEGLEPGTHAVIKALLAPGMRVVDVGANVGLLTLAAARAVGPAGQVVAFEAEPAFAALLRRMVALNGVEWVEIRGQAASREAGTATFHVSPIAGHSSLYALPDEEERASALITVETVRLDEVVQGPVDLVKIDVEGAELDVLAGMDALLDASPDAALVAEFGPSHLARIGQSPDRWFGAFEGHGFWAYAIDEATGRCRRVRAADVADVVSVNVVFARPNSRAARRLPMAG